MASFSYVEKMVVRETTLAVAVTLLVEIHVVNNEFTPLILGRF